jgi:hypothetical protein
MVFMMVMMVVAATTPSLCYWLGAECSIALDCAVLQELGWAGVGVGYMPYANNATPALEDVPLAGVVLCAVSDVDVASH